MRAILDKITGTGSKKELGYSSVMVVYQVDKDTWRGFVLPFDITFEASTKKEVVTILRDMIDSYVDGLREYNHPTHLLEVPLSYEEDKKKWDSISQGVLNQLLRKISKIDSADYYAEAQLPA